MEKSFWKCLVHLSCCLKPCPGQLIWQQFSDRKEVLEKCEILKCILEGNNMHFCKAVGEPLVGRWGRGSGNNGQSSKVWHWCLYPGTSSLFLQRVPWAVSILAVWRRKGGGLEASWIFLVCRQAGAFFSGWVLTLRAEIRFAQSDPVLRVLMVLYAMPQGLSWDRIPRRASLH